MSASKTGIKVDFLPNSKIFESKGDDSSEYSMDCLSLVLRGSIRIVVGPSKIKEIMSMESDLFVISFIFKILRRDKTNP